MKHYRHCSYSLQSCTMTVMALMAMATTAGAQQAGKAGYSTAADVEHPQLTDIPTLYVKTVSGQDPQSKETYVPCELWLVEDGQTTHYRPPTTASPHCPTAATAAYADEVTQHGVPRKSRGG